MAAPLQTLTNASTVWSKRGASKAARRSASPTGKRGARTGKELGRTGSRPWQDPWAEFAGVWCPPAPETVRGAAGSRCRVGPAGWRCGAAEGREVRGAIAPLPAPRSAPRSAPRPRSALRSLRWRGTCSEGVVSAKWNKSEGARFCSPLFQEIQKSPLCLRFGCDISSSGLILN